MDNEPEVNQPVREELERLAKLHDELVEILRCRGIIGQAEAINATFTIRDDKPTP